MAILEDLYEKIFKHSEKDIDETIIHAPAETLVCTRCGKSYPSRGKNDPGYCRECEKIIAPLVGGPLDGQNL